MIYLLIPAVTIIVVFLLGNFVLNRTFRQKVKQLYSEYGQSDKRVDPDSYKELPAPVVRYFRKVLREGAPYISSVRIKHTGFFKTNVKRGWKPIEGEQYFTALVPGFIWKGRTALFTATDSFIMDRGNLKVWLLSCIRIINRSGRWIDEGELIRWLGETVWFPTSLIPSNYISWEAVDDTTANLVFTYKGKRVSYRVHFNGRDEIYRIEAMCMYRQGRREKWVGYLRSYEWHNNFYVPTRVEAAWILDGKEYSYALFELTRIEYGHPEQFAN